MAKPVMHLFIYSEIGEHHTVCGRKIQPHHKITIYPSKTTCEDCINSRYFKKQLRNQAVNKIKGISEYEIE